MRFYRGACTSLPLAFLIYLLVTYAVIWTRIVLDHRVCVRVCVQVRKLNIDPVDSYVISTCNSAGRSGPTTAMCQV